MKLKEVIERLNILNYTGSMDVELSGITYDSRKVKPGSLFVCIDGMETDGHKYIDRAYENGAAAFLLQKDVSVPEGTSSVLVEDTRYGLGIAADNFYGHPSLKLPVIGVTGTKGKTTVTYMIKAIADAAGKNTGVIGTIGSVVGEEMIYGAKTTPEAPDLQELFASMLDKNIDLCAMEVSSQGLMLHRVTGIEFEIGVFTNIETDHIGPKEHRDFDDYLENKLKLFKKCKRAVINKDIKQFKQISDSCPVDHLTYSLWDEADITAREVVFLPDSAEFTVSTPWFIERITVGLPGLFNVANALAAIAVAGSLGIGAEGIKKGLAACKVRGRTEIVASGRGYTVMLDFAHNAMSLENLLLEVRKYAPGRIVCLFGCGGNKDVNRRYGMGEVSGRHADFSIITSDNPRNEEPEGIIADIEKGILKTNGKYIKIVNRREAIKYAIENAAAEDIIILAGKGHENYQIFKDKTIRFDEREIVNEIISELEDGKHDGS